MIRQKGYIKLRLVKVRGKPSSKKEIIHDANDVLSSHSYAKSKCLGPVKKRKVNVGWFHQHQDKREVKKFAKRVFNKLFEKKKEAVAKVLKHQGDRQPTVNETVS